MINRNLVTVKNSGIMTFKPYYYIYNLHCFILKNICSEQNIIYFVLNLSLFPFTETQSTFSEPRSQSEPDRGPGVNVLLCSTHLEPQSIDPFHRVALVVLHLCLNGFYRAPAAFEIEAWLKPNCLFQDTDSDSRSSTSQQQRRRRRSSDPGKRTHHRAKDTHTSCVLLSVCESTCLISWVWWDFR